MYPSTTVRLTLAVAAIGSAVALAPAASAADLGAAPVAETFETPRDYTLGWTGPYIGMSLGYGFGTSEQNYDRNDNHGLATTDPDGFAGSLTAGYNVQVSEGFLLGLEGDLGLMDLSADDKEVYDGHVYRTQYGPLWGTVRARAGVTLERLMLFGTAGVAFMDVDEVSIGNTPGETAKNQDFRAGWVVGGGAEYLISSNVVGKIEYLHMDFGEHQGLSDNREDFSFANTADMVRIGLAYKF